MDPLAADVLKYWQAKDVRSFVYFVREGDDGPIKIGSAGNPNQRVLGLQCGNPRELRILRLTVAGDDLERHIHSFWAQPAGLRGEWFGKGHEQAILDSAVRIEAAQRDALRTAGTLDAHERHELLLSAGIKALFAKAESEAA